MLFYAAYFLKCLEERTWWFCLMTSLPKLGSLGYVAAEQLLEGLLQVSISTYLGTLIDKYSRKRGLITILLLNNFTILAAISSLIACYSIGSKSPKLLLLTIFFSIFNRLFLNAEKTMLGKDWLLVIREDSKLSSLNWYLQFVDQAASVIGSIYGGYLPEPSYKNQYGLWQLEFTLIFTMFVRSILLGVLYHTNDSLVASKPSHTTSKTHSSPLRIFSRQESLLASFGSCILFMTVMGFGSVALGYAREAKVPTKIIGYLKALAAVMSFVGGGLYAVLERTTSVTTAGIVGLIFHQAAVVAVVGSVFLPGSSMGLEGYFGSFTFQNWWGEVSASFNETKKPEAKSDDSSWSYSEHTSILVFLVASAFTLIGQSCLETSIKHIMQVTVPDNERNTVFGVQNSISKGFTMLKDFMVIGLQSPAIFPFLIFTSYGFVSTGHLFFIWYVVKSKRGNLEKQRGEMIHLNNEESKHML